MHQKNWQPALDTLSEINKMAPSNYKILYRMGKCNRELGNKIAARHYFKRSTEVNGNHGRGHFRYGELAY